MDHEPRYVHGFYAEMGVIVDLLQNGNVGLAVRKDAVRPGNASKSDIRHALNVATAF
jgi:hypothetical protein